MITRKQFRGCLKKEAGQEEIRTALTSDGAAVRAVIDARRCLTVALYQHKDMLFLYYEALEEELAPTDLFPELSKLLALWPERDGMTPWAYMHQIYYHAVPKTEQMWERKGEKRRRGRIAYLLPDKLFSYVYYHKKIVDEGLLEGDMYHSIALHEDILFSYFEEPKIFTHIKSETDAPSKVIEEWEAVDPASHFDHHLSGEDNFLFIDEIFSMGKES